jgi:hypothetical protein
MQRRWGGQDRSRGVPAVWVSGRTGRGQRLEILKNPLDRPKVLFAASRFLAIIRSRIVVILVGRALELRAEVSQANEVIW